MLLGIIINWLRQVSLRKKSDLDGIGFICLTNKTFRIIANIHNNTLNFVITKLLYHVEMHQIIQMLCKMCGNY